MDEAEREKADVRLIGRAVARRWNTDPRVMQALINRIGSIAVSTSDKRFLLGAGKFFATIEGQNQQDEQFAERGGSANAAAVANVHIYLPDNGRGDSK